MELTAEVLNDIVDNLPFSLGWGLGDKDSSKFILTGTVLLTAHGLFDKFGDVDILIANCSEPLWSSIVGAYGEDGDYEASCVKVRREKYTYNIIKDDHYLFGVDNTPFQIGDVYLDSLHNAIRAKKDLMRDKDVEHFKTINPRIQAILEYKKDHYNSIDMLFGNKLEVLDATVFPSKERTIAVEPDDIYGGAHRYIINHSLGYDSTGAVYTKDTSVIQFVRKNDDGTIVSGLQSEQVVLALLDRTKKLNGRFPSEYNKKMIEGLEMFLEACKDRVQDRIDRGVMGKLEK